MVEFQPSGFSKGSYLNTSAHWLWRPGGVLSFDWKLPDSKRPFISFHDTEQFEPLAKELAALAASESIRLGERLSSFAEVVRILIEANQNMTEVLKRPADGWSALHAAVASGATGDITLARTLLRDFSTGPRASLLERWTVLANQALERGNFEQFLRSTIDEARKEFGFSAWDGSFS